MPLSAFRDLALAEPALREALLPIDTAPAFAAAAASLARERGLDVSQSEVVEALRAPPRPGAPGGLPYAASVRDGQCVAWWLEPCGRALAAPFFDDDTRVWLRNPYTRFTRREAAPPGGFGAAPAGLIFHMSRCGSTLAARMLAAAGVRVVSEAAAVDAVVQSGDAGSLRRLAKAMGGGAPCVLKLDPWHAHAMPLFLEAFPGTPWIFLYREPLEVLASHARSPGRHTLPGALDARALAMSPEDITRCPREEWPARVLARICEAALSRRGDPLGMFLDYRELPDALWERVAPHFGLGGGRAAMLRAAQEDAKRPGSPFVPDSAAKQAEGAAHAAFARAAGLDRIYRALREPA